MFIFVFLNLLFYFYIYFFNRSLHRLFVFQEARQKSLYGLRISSTQYISRWHAWPWNLSILTLDFSYLRFSIRRPCARPPYTLCSDLSQGSHTDTYLDFFRFQSCAPVKCKSVLYNQCSISDRAVSICTLNASFICHFDFQGSKSPQGQCKTHVMLSYCYFCLLNTIIVIRSPSQSLPELAKYLRWRSLDPPRVKKCSLLNLINYCYCKRGFNILNNKTNLTKLRTLKKLLLSSYSLFFIKCKSFLFHINVRFVRWTFGHLIYGNWGGEALM